MIIRDGEPWFVATDVCRILDFDTSLAVNGRERVDRDGNMYRSGGLDEDEKGTDIVSTPKGPQEVLTVSEPGLYSLILKSRKPEAKAFKRWVTHEVLPFIRKTGRYDVPGSTTGNDHTEQLKVRRLAIMEMNAKTRQAKLLFDTAHRFRDRLSDKAIESVLAVGAKLLTGLELIPLPATERMYTAADIAAEAGVTANMVGRVANRYGLKTPEYG